MAARRRIGVAVALLAAVLAGCSDDGDDAVSTTTTTDGADDAADVGFSLRPVLEVQPFLADQADGCTLLGATTPLEADDDAVAVIFPSDHDGDGRTDLCYRLGPVPTAGDAVLSGDIIATAEAVDEVGTWVVAANLVGGLEALDDAAAAPCFERAASCPTGLLAIVLDGVVLSAPTLHEPVIDLVGAGFVIHGPWRDRAGAEAVAARLVGAGS